jgi:hypothetical protein
MQYLIEFLDVSFKAFFWMKMPPLTTSAHHEHVVVAVTVVLAVPAIGFTHILTTIVPIS